MRMWNEMLFNYVLGIEEVDKEKVKVNHRETVRAIILKDNNILMVHCNKGDYKFPGGGINKEENHEEALKREVREETGYIVSSVKSKTGIVTERNLDEYEKDSVFEMISHYYLCEVSDKQTLQQLDEYEAELEFCPRWISLDEAIQLNEEILEKETKDKNRWVHRETAVLKTLREYYKG